MMNFEGFDFKKFEKQYIIRETLLDVYGHMNNASYIQLFEEARWDLITSRGFGLKRVLEEKVGPVILSLKTDFLKELSARDEIVITTQVTRYKGKIGTIYQEMIKDDGEVACKAEFVFGMFDMKARKLIAPSREWALAFADEV